MFRSKKYLLILLLVLVVGLFIGYALKGNRADDTLHATAVSKNVKAVQDVHSLYICPMMCIPPMAVPGNCPICGMALIPFSSGGEDSAQRTSGLRLTDETVAHANIQLAPVERKFVSAEVRLFGQVDYDPAHTAVISAFMPGVIDRVYVKRAGQFVRWGDPLFDIYSSDLLSAQQQLFEAMKHAPGLFAFQAGTPHVARDALVQTRKGTEKGDLKSPEAEKAMETISAVRNKLRLLGMPKRDVDELMKKGEATGIATVYASLYGQVTQQNAYEGSFVNTGVPVFTIADPQFVWIRLDAYETDYPWIRRGQEVTFTTDAYPGEVFKGRVIYIDPVFDVKSRTVNIGAVCSEDQGGRLKAGMLVRAVIHSALTEEGRVVNDRSTSDRAPLVIPASAPLITGKRAVVYVAKPGETGVFEGREVRLGPKAGDHYVVVSGLEEGEQVVVSGNFKIDSALQILAKSSMMGLEGGGPADEHQRHGGSDVMHEDYRSQRMSSRTEGGLNSEDPAQAPPASRFRPGEASKEADLHRQKLIQRRKPGLYGDSTRPRSLSQE